MRTLVFCDDSAHPASLTRDGLAALGQPGLQIDWVEDPAGWSTDSLNQYPLVIFSKANNRSRATMNLGPARRQDRHLSTMLPLAAVSLSYIRVRLSTTTRHRFAA